MATGLNWDSILSDLRSEPWAWRDGQWERTTFIGTVFGLYPSGKYYTPWACSNVNPCDTCGGKGKLVRPIKRRIAKKWTNYLDRFQRLCQVRGVGWNSWAMKHNRHASFIQSRERGHPCPACGGMGSREAYLDACFQEDLEAEAEQHGVYVTEGEGDPCDLLVGECRDSIRCPACDNDDPDRLDVGCDQATCQQCGHRFPINDNDD
jgi:hypothetical protein